MTGRGQLRRAAIDIFKEAFLAGTPFTVPEAQAFLIAKGYLRWQLGKRRVGEWLREARYELADTHVSVTYPAVKLGYVSNPNATPNERVVGLAQPIADAKTRFANLEKQAEAAANQVDASPIEIERYLRLKISNQVVAELV